MTRRLLSMFIAAWFLLLWAELPTAFGRRIYPGVYRGTYHVDRWGQHRFDFLFVCPSLEKELKALVGLPLSIDATAIDQPRSLSGGMVTKIGRVQKLEMPVQIDVSWLTPPGVSSHTLRKANVNDSVKIKINVKNLADADLPMTGDTFSLVFCFHKPSGPGTTDPMGYWSHHNTYDNGSLFGADRPKSSRRLSVCTREVNLRPENQTFDARRLPVAHRPAPYDPNPPLLGPGKTHSWTVAIENVPASEYELAVIYEQYQKAQEKYLHIESNKLRLDVLAKEPICWQGLEVGLRRQAEEKVKAGQPIPLEAVFTNTGDKTLRLGLLTFGGKVDLSDDLLCYDESGTMLPVQKTAGNFADQKISLEPGKDFIVKVEAPAKTVLARLAFWHRLGIQDAKPGESALGTGYAFSAHLLLNKKQD